MFPSDHHRQRETSLHQFANFLGSFRLKDCPLQAAQNRGRDGDSDSDALLLQHLEQCSVPSLLHGGSLFTPQPPSQNNGTAREQGADSSPPSSDGVARSLTFRRREVKDDDLNDDETTASTTTTGNNSSDLDLTSSGDMAIQDANELPIRLMINLETSFLTLLDARFRERAGTATLTMPCHASADRPHGVTNSEAAQRQTEGTESDVQSLAEQLVAVLDLADEISIDNLIISFDCQHSGGGGTVISKDIAAEQVVLPLIMKTTLDVGMPCQNTTGDHKAMTLQAQTRGHILGTFNNNNNNGSGSHGLPTLIEVSLNTDKLFEQLNQHAIDVVSSLLEDEAQRRILEPCIIHSE